MTRPNINYFGQNSDVTLNTSQPAPGSASWRPGAAGLSERAAMGQGEGNGWFVYFYERWLVVELWIGGQWEFTRAMDCSRLTQVSGTRWRNLVSFGWNLREETVSLGCVSRNLDNPDDARSVHETFHVPNLGLVFAHPPRVYLGKVPVKTGPGQIQWRSIDGKVSTVGGRVSSRHPLTPGELARLSGREVRYA